MMLFAIAALSLQPAQTPEPQAPARQDGAVTVIERDDVAETPPIRSRIARPASDNFAPDPIATMHLREWANCAVLMNRPRALALLATPLNSPEQATIIDQLTGHRFTRRTICARFRSMRVDNLVLRGAIAEALDRWEERRRRSAGPLPQVPAPGIEAGRAGQIAQLGRCVVERDPEGVERVMATRPGTRSSSQALAALSDRVRSCLPAGLRARDIHPLTLRGAIGEPFYLRRRNQAGRAAAGAVTG